MDGISDIYDWVRGTTGLYTSDFKEEIELDGRTIHRNDWVVKEDDGSFSILSNLEYMKRLDEELARS